MSREVYGPRIVAAQVAGIARRIGDDYTLCKPSLAVVLPDGMVFASDLMRALPERTAAEAQVEFVFVTHGSAGIPPVPHAQICRAVPPAPQSFRGRDVLIVMGGGEPGAFSMIETLERDIEMAGADTVRVASLVWRRGAPRQPRYVGFEVAGDAEIAGCGIGNHYTPGLWAEDAEDV